MKLATSLFIALIFASTANGQILKTYQSDGLYGYTDRFGRIITEPTFSHAKEFGIYDAYSVVSKDGRSYFINRAGEIVLNKDGYESIEKSGFDGATAIVKETDGYHIIDMEGKQIGGPYHSVKKISAFGYLINATADSPCNMVNFELKPYFDSKYKNLSFFNDYSLIATDSEGLLHIINLKGDVIIGNFADGRIAHASEFWPEKVRENKIAKEYDMFFIFKDTNGKWGACDEFGWLRMDVKYKTYDDIDKALRKKKSAEDFIPLMSLKQFYFTKSYENSAGRAYQRYYKESFDNAIKHAVGNPDNRPPVITVQEAEPYNRVFFDGDFYGLYDSAQKPLKFAGRYENLFWNADMQKYYGSYGQFSTYIGEDGEEETPIAMQMFSHAIENCKDNVSLQRDMFAEIAFVDADNHYKATSMAYNNLGVLAQNTGDLKTAESYYNKGYELDHRNSVALEHRNAIREIWRNEEKQARREQLLSALSGLADALSEGARTFTAISESKQSAATSYQSEAPSSMPSKKMQRNSGKKNISAINNSRSASRTYSGYVENLIEMNTYPDRYSDSRRTGIQSAMKRIRESNNANADNLHISKSEWEDWDGRKK